MAMRFRQGPLDVVLAGDDAVTRRSRARAIIAYLAYLAYQVPKATATYAAVRALPRITATGRLQCSYHSFRISCPKHPLQGHKHPLSAVSHSLSMTDRL
jgi:hypothetical protein